VSPRDVTWLELGFTPNKHDDGEAQSR
jgi:hypothetical protein